MSHFGNIREADDLGFLMCDMCTAVPITSPLQHRTSVCFPDMNISSLQLHIIASHLFPAPAA